MNHAAELELVRLAYLLNGLAEAEKFPALVLALRQTHAAIGVLLADMPDLPIAA